MILGKITENQEAIIELEVVDSNWQEKIKVAIDIGFDGYLTLPLNLINRLKLRRTGHRQAMGIW